MRPDDKPDGNHKPSLTAINANTDIGETLAISGFDLTTVGALAMAIVDGSGNQIVSFGGGTQYADGAARGTATGTLAMVDDGTNIQSAKGDTDGTMHSNLTKVGSSAFALGQQLAAASLPVVLTAAQITTLTPLATVAATQSGAWNITNISGTISLPTGAATLAEQQTQTASLSVLDDWDEANRAAVNTIAGQVGVQGGSGALNALTQRVVLATDQPAIPTVTTVTTVSTLTGGGVAHDSVDSGNPHKIGFKAYSPDGTTPGTAVAELDRTDGKADLDGREFVNNEHPRWWSFHSDGSSALTDTSVQADPGDGFQIVITEIIFSTGAATACNIFFEEGSTKVLGPWYLEAIAGRGVFWQGKKHITASTAVTVTTSAAINQSLDIQGYIQAV